MALSNWDTMAWGAEIVMVNRLVKIAPEREYGRTWLYRGFVLNDWWGFFCFRPVECEFPEGMRKWVLTQPESTHGNWGKPQHKLRNGQVTGCLEYRGDLDACCRLIDRWWEAQEERGEKRETTAVGNTQG